MAFAIIDAMVGRGVQDNVGPQIHQDGPGGRMIRYIEVFSRKWMHIMRSQRLLKVLAELSVGSEECDLHPIRKR